jgi:hypothetical protein
MALHSDLQVEQVPAQVEVLGLSTFQASLAGLRQITVQGSSKED